MYRSLLLIFIFLLITLSAEAQYRTPVHEISHREGLSNGAVNSIQIDAEGFVWFGTWNGLNRYDGKSITTYLPGSSEASIHNHVIREIYPSQLGPIWMLTNKGIGRYDNLTNRFGSFFTEESEQVNNENDIILNHSDEFGTLASVIGLGLYQFNPATQAFETISFGEELDAALKSIKRIELTGDQAFCLTEEGRLVRIMDSTAEVVMSLPISSAITFSTSVSIDNQPHLFFAQRSGPALVVDIVNKKSTYLEIPNDVITAFAVSKAHHRVWVGTEKGAIYYYNPLTGVLEVPAALEGMLRDNPIATRILSMKETDPDLLWIGTDGRGVFTVRLSEFPNRCFPSEQLAYPIVRSILVTRNRHLLIGTKGGGIDVFDPNGKHLRTISTANGLSNNSVLSLHERPDGSLWVGTDGWGVDILSFDYQTIRNFPRDFDCICQPEFASVYRIFEDSDGRIILGTSGYGGFVIAFNRPEASDPITCEQLILETESDQQKQIVYAITEEKPGIIWIGSRGNGLYRYNMITRRVIEQITSQTHPRLIRNDDILSMLTDRSGQVWVGSSNGFFGILPLATDSIAPIELPEWSDLSNTSIHSIRQDNRGNLWVTTNQGLSMIAQNRNTIRSFNLNDGLINYEYSDGASWYDQNNSRLLVGGTVGVDNILTEKLQFSSYFPPLIIHQLYIRNVPIQPGDNNLFEGSINHQTKLRLRYNQNTLTLDVRPLAYWGQERYRISYRLHGLDADWIINPPNLMISYSDLKPGTYTLEMRVSDENGTWSDQIRRMEIRVLKPIWFTTVAILSYILLAFGAQLIIFTAYRRREARRKEAALQEFKKQKEEELQNYKLEFFTQLAHEFRTPLTLITAHTHALMEEGAPPRGKQRLVKILNNSIKLQKLVLEIMRFRKLEKGKEPLSIRSEKPVELIRDVVSDLDLLAQQRHIRCEIQALDPNMEFNTDAEKFQRIFTNLISNAIKYNRDYGWVKTSVYRDNGELSVEIEDSGVGISPEFTNQVFEPFGITSGKGKGHWPGFRSTGLGLAVTRGLVELLKGTITFESRVNEGTRFICRFRELDPNTEGMLVVETEESEILPTEEVSMESLASINGDLQDHKARILLVDDDPEILEVLTEFLRNDYNLLTASNGVEAYRKILSDKPDLLVSDIMMPEMDGIELCAKVRANVDTSHLPVILLTARVETEDRIEGLKAGADSYIPKPFHPEHLRVRIMQLINLRKGILRRFGKEDDNPALIKEIPDPFLQKLLRFIDENLDDETLSSEKICENLAISKSSLYNKTRSVLGSTPHSLINQRRLQKAATLLRSTMLTVSEIIDQTGFSSRTHFYDLFNQAFNCSPTDYRNQPH